MNTIPALQFAFSPTAYDTSILAKITGIFYAHTSLLLSQTTDNSISSSINFLILKYTKRMKKNYNMSKIYIYRI